MSDTGTSLRNLPTIDSLVVSELVVVHGTFNQHVVDTLALTQGVFGTNGNQSVCSESYPVSLGTRNLLTLTFPYTSPSLTLDLRVPEFNNDDSIKTEVVIRRTIGNQLLSGRINSWPKIEVLKFAFAALTQAQRDAFLTFANTSLGLEIGLLDQENRQWRGVIISSSVEAVQRSRTCDFLISFEFRGKEI